MNGERIGKNNGSEETGADSDSFQPVEQMGHRPYTLEDLVQERHRAILTAEYDRDTVTCSLLKKHFFENVGHIVIHPSSVDIIWRAYKHFLKGLTKKQVHAIARQTRRDYWLVEIRNMIRRDTTFYVIKRPRLLSWPTGTKAVKIFIVWKEKIHNIGEPIGLIAECKEEGGYLQVVSPEETLKKFCAAVWGDDGWANIDYLDYLCEGGD